MFLMFLVVASAVFYGRVYCGYLCPQMIFSEASVALENWLRGECVEEWPLEPRARAPRCVLRGAGAGSVFLAFIFIAYFVEPRDLFRTPRSPSTSTPRRASRARPSPLLTFLDFTLVRQTFCTTVCPYGYLQGLLGDGNTLLVHYRDEEHACIECKKCVRVCPMEIDIRKSPFQIECIHCAECMDACGEIMARREKAGPDSLRLGREGPARAGLAANRGTAPAACVVLA